MSILRNKLFRVYQDTSILKERLGIFHIAETLLKDEKHKNYFIFSKKNKNEKTVILIKNQIIKLTYNNSNNTNITKHPHTKVPINATIIKALKIEITTEKETIKFKRIQNIERDIFFKSFFIKSEEISQVKFFGSKNPLDQIRLKGALEYERRSYGSKEEFLSLLYTPESVNQALLSLNKSIKTQRGISFE